ncbi:MAG: nicotinate phosphoribosyltransferase [Spirochaetota bacterium]
MRYDRLTGLTTDFYELSMVQGYFLKNMNRPAVFDMFFRSQPFGGGYSIFCGLDPLLEALEGLHFSPEDIDYLASQGIFQDDFLEFLKEFRFTGDIYAVDEGTAVFPNEPLIRAHGPMSEVQLIESLLLNIINFHTLIATKSARVFDASGGGKILEFGLRRSQGLDGAFSAARASYVGGAVATSDTWAAKELGIPAKGTMAHSWVMAFDSEADSFRAFAEIYPENAVLLIDTYDTLGSGIENAIIVGKEQKEKGYPIGVRLDSGDLDRLSREVRRRLDEAGLEDAKITASNELNEEIIHQLVTSGAPIDAWGVGTHLVTGSKDAALNGVYKLAAKTPPGKSELEPVIKLSNNPEKTTNPGVKKIYRFFDSDDSPMADLLCFDHEFRQGIRAPLKLSHPSSEMGDVTLSDFRRVEEILRPRITGGKRSSPPESLDDKRERTVKNINALNRSYKRLINPHVYAISLSEELKRVKKELVAKLG